ncbi:CCHC-type domain-containing protein [Trichonephila inaurata madagascariensis]|uniref:CCHC-type domain-containing protein n=1 Tax=Trichonephila inaurata madagascariensis TaxID=2747483 RepID=A0A8X6WRI6_9ARAC|nr:CCHC-type domain-containing protein [Trichonephila inaurata madagascariensis]
MVREQQEMVREQQELVREQQEFEKENESLDREFQLEKLRLENERLKGLTSTPEAKVSIYELRKAVPKFEMKDGDIVLFLTLFERQAKRVSIEKRHWVSSLLALMPSEINQLMARETEEKYGDYDYIKGLLMKCFKLSAEMFRQKFVKHQRNPAQSWHQLKRRVPGDVREQFVDNWVKSVVPGDLADKLDKGASLRPKDVPFFWKAKLPMESNTGTCRGCKPKCFIYENVGHLARECPKITRKTPPCNARSNIITAKGTELEFTKEVVTASLNTSLHSHQHKEWN